jgi:hypothetical protein
MNFEIFSLKNNRPSVHHIWNSLIKIIQFLNQEQKCKFHTFFGNLDYPLLRKTRHAKGSNYHFRIWLLIGYLTLYIFTTESVTKAQYEVMARTVDRKIITGDTFILLFFFSWLSFFPTFPL